jgi:hypothetical protein
MLSSEPAAANATRPLPAFRARPFTSQLFSDRLERLVPNVAPVAAVLAITAMLVALAYGMNHTSYLVWGGFWVAPVLLVLSIPVAYRAARLDGDVIGRIVLAAAALKVLVAPLMRYWMAYGLYGGASDATAYHTAGELLAPLFRHGNYGELGQISGTRFLEVLTGQVYAVIGPTRLGGFMVFSWLGFLGLYLFYRAFRIAYPDGDGRRYALLVFFFPTLFFWPSSIGKDAFMVLVLGVAALGTAQLLTGRIRGLIWLALGMWGATIVRPHMALIVGAGLAVAAPIAALRGGASNDGRRRGRMGGVVLLFGLIVSAPTLIGVAENFFNLESLNTQTAQEQFDEVTRRSGENGSTFTAFSPNNPVGFILSTGTVLFRPFPGEVRNAQGLLTSLECLALLVLCLLALRRLFRLPRETFRRPYVAFTVGYTFAFIYAFSSIVNFGILARQRAQLLPLVFVALCLPLQRIPESTSASR